MKRFEIKKTHSTKHERKNLYQKKRTGIIIT